jgi:hypothetical protein
LYSFVICDASVGGKSGSRGFGGNRRRRRSQGSERRVVVSRIVGLMITRRGREATMTRVLAAFLREVTKSFALVEGERANRWRVRPGMVITWRLRLRN